jgi:DNA-binding transcriptional LysR family regulator
MNIREMLPAAPPPLNTGRLRELDLNLLVTLETLLTHQNTARAAEELNTTQPTVSHALLRLRGHFQDDLLVPKGREMVLTPLAQQLMGPLRNILMQADALLTQKSAFDPRTSSGTLSIVATDYFFTVLGADVLRRVAMQAPNLTIAADTAKHDVLQRLERGEIDVAAGLLPTAFSDHPTELVYQDSPVCVAWRDNLQVGDNITLERYLAANHVVWRATGLGELSFKESFLQSLGYQTNVARATTTLEMVPQLIIGTNYLATIPRRAAEYYARVLPIRIISTPIEFPKVSVIVQWHHHRNADPMLQWFIGLLRQCAKAMPAVSERSARTALPAD